MSTYTPLDLPTVTRVKTSSGSHIEPGLVESWTDAQKLAWHAAVVAADSGLAITVSQAGHLFSVGSPGVSRNGILYRDAWTLLNGINAGAEAAAQAGHGRDGLVPLRLVPVEVFGAEDGYGLGDAVEAWSDCNRARGHIYRVDEDYMIRLPGETVEIFVRPEDLPFFERYWGES